MTTATHNSAVSSFSKLAKTAQQLRVNLDQVFIDFKANCRVDYNDDDMNELKAAIEATGGIKVPIEIVAIRDLSETEHKPYALIAGFRRCLALKDLEQTDPAFGKDILAILIDTDSIASLKLSQLIENVQRVNLNPLEAASAIRDAMDDQSTGLKATDIAKMTGLSQPKISQLLKLLTLSPKIQEMVKKGEISLSHARVIMYDVPLSRQDDMAMAAKGMTFGEFEAEVKRLFKGSDSAAATEGGNGAAAAGTVSTGNSTQKGAQLIRAQRLKTVYLEYFKKQRETAVAAGDENGKGVWDIRIDTIQWVMHDKSELGSVTAEFDKELEEKKADEEANKKADGSKKEYMLACIKSINDVYNKLPEEGQSRPTLAACFAQKQQEISTLLADSEKAKTLGFTIDDLDDFMASLHKFYEDEKKKRAERVVKTQAAKDKKKAEAAAAEALKAAGGTDAGGTSGAATTTTASAVDQAAVEGGDVQTGENSDMTDEELLAGLDENDSAAADAVNA